ncbi:MAG: cytochrome c3 family protein [Thermodesulfobacteriota bacterium]
MSRNGNGLARMGRGLWLASLVALAVLAGDPGAAFGLAVECANCHEPVMGAAHSRPATPLGCMQCHISSVLAGRHQLVDHDKTILPPNGGCDQCHVANVYVQHQGLYDPNATNLNRGCQVCHNDNPTYDAVIATGKAGTPVDCFACHNPAAANHATAHDQLSTATACAACHSSVDFPAIFALHRDDCAKCHASTRQAVIDTIDAGKAGSPVNCENCHGAHNATLDHNNLSTSGNCSSCHTTGDFAAILATHLGNCSLCHGSGRSEVVATIAAGKGFTGVPVNCENCHAGHPDPATDHNNLATAAACSSCHATTDFAAIYATHRSQCGMCHASTKADVTATIDAGRGLAGALQDCQGCHTGGTGSALTHGTDFASVEPAHDNLQADASCGGCHHGVTGVARLSQHPSCATCHGSGNALVQQAITGGATTAQLCTSCHTAGGAIFHATDFAGVEPAHDNLQDNGTCTGCHATAGTARLSQHPSCATCHGSANALVQQAITSGAVAVQSCTACHTAGGALAHGTDNTTAAAAHNNFIASGNCSTCHGQATAEARLGLHQSCLQCHTSSRQAVIDTIAAGKLGTQVTCDNCHAGHPDPATDHDRLATAAACSSCHATGSFVAILAAHSDACGLCHASSKASVTATISQGVAGLAVDCVSCHDGTASGAVAHGIACDTAGPVHNMLATTGNCSPCHASADFGAVCSLHLSDCAKCHSSTRPEVAQAISQGVAGQAVSCESCHSPHGAAEHNMLAATGDCAVCHTDKVTGTTFQYIHSYHPPLAVYGGSAVDRCLTCHQSSRPEVQATIATGRTGSPVDCQGCHVASHPAITQPHLIHDNVLVNTGSTCGLCHVANMDTHTDMRTSANCSGCHASADQNAINALHGNDCLRCHISGKATVLATVRTGIAGTPINCEGCHTGTAGGAVRHATDFAGIEPAHNNLQADASCGSCHAATGVERLSQHPTCATCHGSANSVVTAAIAAGATAVQTCTACHKTGGAVFHGTDFASVEPAHDNLQDNGSCAGCHHATSGVERLSQHPTCATCHGSANSVVTGAIAAGATAAQACTSCHRSGGAVFHGTTNATAAAVHDRFVASGTCSSCHIQGSAEQRLALHTLGCSQCHASTSSQVIATIDAGQAGTPVSCENCHGGLNHVADHDMTVVPQPSCGNCHDSNVYIEHVDRRGLACSICHGNPLYADVIAAGAAGTLVTCLDCHDNPGPMHHTTSQATTGNCVYCHTDPRPWAAAPTLAACRQCHIGTDRFVIRRTTTSPSHSFNTTGAITDFGACFACHAPVPYHGKPTQTPYCWDLSPAYLAVNAPGKGSFNIWARTMQYADSHWEGTPYQSQADRYCAPRSRSDWWNPQVSFRWATVVYNGAATQVPTFDATGATATTPPHSQIMVAGNCSTCHTTTNIVSGTHGNRCTGCHLSRDPEVIAAIDDAMSGMIVDCTTCHGDAGHNPTVDHNNLSAAPGCGTSGCHSLGTGTFDNIYALHQSSCGLCHTSSRAEVTSTITAGKAGTAVSCTNCHGSQHHTGPDAVNGRCTVCHDDPRPAVWAGAPVGQLACRECHTDASGRIWTWTAAAPNHAWNTGAGIQDFGACFACHAPQPYHGKPTTAPLCWDLDNNFFAAPGKGAFNLFRTTFQKPQKYYEHTSYERQGKDICRNARSNWSNPAVSFNWAQISYAGSPAYGQTVPTFGPPSGGDACAVSTTGTYIEAERVDTLGDNWELRSDANANSGQYLRALRNAGSNPTGTSAQYRLQFPETGTYYLWFRVNANGSSGDDTLWYGLDGTRVGDMDSPANNSYTWVRTRSNTGPSNTAITVSSTGMHTLNIWSKEDGLRLDGVYLTRSTSSISGSIPSGAKVVDPSQCPN